MTKPRGGRISSLRAFRRARDSEAKGRVDWKRSRWPDAKFEVAGAKCALRNGRSPAQSFARSLTHSLAREKRDERGSRPRKSTATRRREKRGERREKREDRIQTPRGRQRSPNEAARGPTRGANPFLCHTALWWDLWRPHLGTIWGPRHGSKTPS